MFKQRTMMLMMGQRAERLREERIRNEESLRMRKDIRSLRRTRKREARCKGMFLGYQDKWIDRLQKEADNMETDLKVTQCRPYKLEDKQYTTRLMHWIEQNDSTKVEIAKTRAKIAELKQQIRTVDFELDDTRKAVARRKKNLQSIRVPEERTVLDRLDTAVEEFGEGIRENRRLVDEIHHLVSKEAVWRKALSKVEHALNVANRDLYEHTEVATDTYKKLETTNRYKARIAADYEQMKATSELEMTNLQSKINVLKRTEAFIVEKNKYREDEFAEQRKILLARQNPVRREIQRYENVLGEIHHKKDGQELAEVVETFVRLLEENWMLFQNVQLTKERNHEMLHYIAGIKDMLDKLEYTPEEISRLAGIFRGVHEENAIVFLCEIEKYVNKLWGIQDYLEYVAFETRRRKSLVPGAVNPKGPRHPRFPRVSTVSVFPPFYDRREECDEYKSITDLGLSVPRTREE
ncbi:hypothetical protein BaRGS_00031770, partial [Batillaria attramentaria]